MAKLVSDGEVVQTNSTGKAEPTEAIIVEKVPARSAMATGVKWKWVSYRWSFTRYNTSIIRCATILVERSKSSEPHAMACNWFG